MSLSLFGSKSVLCGLLAVASPMVVLGGINPTGSEYSIAGSLPGDQSFPSLTLGADGGILVWQDNSVNPNGLRILGLQLNGGTPFAVSSAANSKSTGTQEKPQAGLFSTGGGLVVWQTTLPASQQVYARFFDSTGKFLKNDIRISTHAKNRQTLPRVAVSSSDEALVVWSSEGQDGSMQGVFGQLFSSSGAKIGKEFQVNVTTLFNQRNPSVAALSDGNFVVVWVSELQRSPASVDVYARIFSPSGAPLTGEMLVNTPENHICATPGVAASAQGGFGVVWNQNENTVVPTPTLLLVQNTNGVVIPGNELPSVDRSPDGWDVFARLFTTAGVPTTDAFRVNRHTYGDQYSPQVAAAGNSYVAVWSALNQTNSLGQVDSREGVFGQQINSDGSVALDEDFHANTVTVSRQLQPVVSGDETGHFIVVWSSFLGGANSFDLRAQNYSLTTP